MGGALPIVALTETTLGILSGIAGAGSNPLAGALNSVTGLLSGSGIDQTLDRFFARFMAMPGGTLINNQAATYPFANQAVAANAIIAQPLNVSLKMLCPVKTPAGYPIKLATITALQGTLAQHNNQGGLYSVVTPSYIYTNCIMTGMRDVSAGETKQAQYAWQLDFFQPLVTPAGRHAGLEWLTANDHQWNRGKRDSGCCHGAFHRKSDERDLQYRALTPGAAMSTIVAFTPSSIQAFSFQATLGGSQYTVTILWNVFGQRYYIKVEDLSGNLIIFRALTSSGPTIISQLSWVNGVATVTSSLPHNVPVGWAVNINVGQSNSGFDGNFQGLSTGANTITYNLSSNPNESASITGNLNFLVNLIQGYIDDTLVFFPSGFSAICLRIVKSHALLRYPDQRS